MKLFHKFFGQSGDTHISNGGCKLKYAATFGKNMREVSYFLETEHGSILAIDHTGKCSVDNKFDIPLDI